MSREISPAECAVSMSDERGRDRERDTERKTHTHTQAAAKQEVLMLYLLYKTNALFFLAVYGFAGTTTQTT